MEEKLNSTNVEMAVVSQADKKFKIFNKVCILHFHFFFLFSFVLIVLRFVCAARVGGRDSHHRHQQRPRPWLWFSLCNNRRRLDKTCFLTSDHELELIDLKFRFAFASDSEP